METDYHVFIHRPGPNWLTDRPITEQPLEGHFGHMTRLEEQGILVLGGGFLDGAGAMGVIRTDSLTEAETIVASDPAVRDGIVTAEVHPWFVTMGGSISPSGG
jgi:uncharacterized protein YciI